MATIRSGLSLQSPRSQHALDNPRASSRPSHIIGGLETKSSLGSLVDKLIGWDADMSGAPVNEHAVLRRALEKSAKVLARNHRAKL